MVIKRKIEILIIYIIHVEVRKAYVTSCVSSYLLNTRSWTPRARGAWVALAAHPSKLALEKGQKGDYIYLEVEAKLKRKERTNQ